MHTFWQRAFIVPTPPSYWRMVRVVIDVAAMGLIAAFVLEQAWSRPWTGPVLAAVALAAALVARVAMPPQSDAKPDDGVAAWTIMAAVAMALVPTLAFALHLLGGTPVGVDSVVGAAAAVGLGAAFVSKRAHAATSPGNRFLPTELLWSALARRSGVLLGAMSVAALWYLRHDGSVPPLTCIGEGAWIAAGHNPEGLDLLRDNVGDSRLGNVGLIAGSMALFEGEALRMLYTTLGGLLALGGYLMGLACTGSRAWAWCALLMLPLNPYTMSIPLVDENVLAAAISATTLGLALQRRPAWWLVGALAGLLFAMRHPFAVSLPALLWLAWTQARNWRHVAAAGGGMVALSALEHVHHWLAFGSLLRFESTAQFPSLSYDLLGWTVRWPGMLNWPLHDHLVRTPHNPLPMLVGWGPHLADHLGLLLFAAMLLGVATLFGRRRRLGWFFLAWWGPVMAGLALQESWDYPNKMGVLVIGMPVFAAWTVAGAQSVLGSSWRDSWRARATWLALLLGCWLFIGGLRDWRAPADGRYFRLHDLEPHESVSHLEEAARVAADVGLLPDVDRAARHGPIWTPWKWRSLRSLESPFAWGWYPGEVPVAGPAITWELDLSGPIWRRANLARPGDGPPHIDLTLTKGQVVATGVQVSWEPRPLTVTAVRGRSLTLIEIAFREPRVRDGSCAPKLEPCRCQFFDSLEKGASELACSDSRVLLHTDHVLRIRAPAGGVSIAATVNEIGNVVWLWKGLVTTEEVILQPPVQFWHN